MSLCSGELRRECSVKDMLRQLFFSSPGAGGGGVRLSTRIMPTVGSSFDAGAGAGAGAGEAERSAP